MDIYFCGYFHGQKGHCLCKQVILEFKITQINQNVWKKQWWRIKRPWARYLTGLPLHLWVVRLKVTGGSLTRRPNRSLRFLLVGGTLTNKW